MRLRFNISKQFQSFPGDRSLLFFSFLFFPFFSQFFKSLFFSFLSSLFTCCWRNSKRAYARVHVYALIQRSYFRLANGACKKCGLLIYRPQITRAKKSAWFLLLLIRHSKTGSLVAERATSSGHCFLHTGEFNSEFTRLAIILPFHENWYEDERNSLKCGKRWFTGYTAAGADRF